jgi:segregation and condensation protein A
MDIKQRLRYYRSLFKYDRKVTVTEDEENVLKDVTMFQLIKAFQYAMSTIPKVTVHEVRNIPYTIEEQGRFVMTLFSERQNYHFRELLMHMKEKVQVVVTFIALLELIRAQRVRIEIRGAFNDFELIRTEDQSEYIDVSSEQ